MTNGAAQHEAAVQRSSALSALMTRLAAYFLDCLLLFAAMAACQLALIAADLHPFLAPGSERVAPYPVLLHAWIFASTTLPFFFYFAFSFSSKRGATLGQRLVGLRVSSPAGARLDRGPAFVRSAVLLVPFELNHTVMVHAGPWFGGSSAAGYAGFVLVWLLSATYLALPLLRRDRRSLHDLAVGSLVSDQAKPGAAEL